MSGTDGSAPFRVTPRVPPVFTRYQKFVVAILAFLQFTIMLDFMIMSPLGALLMPDLHITTRQFGLVVSAYAFSAGISGLLAAGFADNFDRKRLLLFFYAGFVLGTLLCGVAPTLRVPARRAHRHRPLRRRHRLHQHGHHRRPLPPARCAAG